MGTAAVVPAASAGAGAGTGALQLWASRGGRIGAEVVGRLVAASGDVRSVLAEAQGKEIQNESLAPCLKEARHAASRAADLLGELDYYRIQDMEMEEDDGKAKETSQHDGVSQVTEDMAGNSAFSTQDSPSAALQVVPYVLSARNTIPEPRPGISREIADLAEQCCTLARDLRKALVLERLDDRIRIAQKQQSAWTDRRETSSCPTEPKVYGRDDKRDEIISMLKGEGSSGRNLSVLAIVGNGGVGKTTLAKAVFNDPAVSEAFDIRLWVYVSVYFDQAKIIHEMLESLLGDKHENIKGLKELQDILELAFKSKRVLLVLDDMWEDRDTEKENWDGLLIPLLANDVQGNKILVTTRKPSVAKFVEATDNVDLDGLKPPDFWHFFKECAFGDANYRGGRRLEKIGQTIVAQLKGNPLAAKSVGRVLRRRLDVEYWTRVLDNSEWKHDENGIMPALMISYIYLPVHLQPCFSYCALFPKYHRYEKERLVNIWIAQGLVCSTDTDTHRRLEDIGSEFFDDLVEWGFLQKEFESGRFLTMHDLIHDLAQIVSSDESFSIENNEPRAAPRLVRHVSIITEWEYKAQLDGTVRRNEPFLQVFSNSLVKLQQNKLSTLMLFGPHDLDFANTFRKEFSEVKCVRVLRLDMVVHDLDSMVGNISAFINLHYLELDCFYKLTRLELPEAVCRLYHLHVLDIKDWGASTDLPKGMNKLVNLRHFIAMEGLHAKLAGIEKMVSLQELKAFAVRQESEFSLPQLRRLNQLRGSIWIHNLDNVGSQEEASEARICDKVHLTTLRLSWNGMLGGKVGAISNKKNPILEDLKPHAGLVNLRIEAYGLRSPSWLGDNVHVTSLRSLHLNNCFKWRTIPQPQQLPLLRELHLTNMLSVSKITIGSLEILELRNLQSLRQCILLDKEQLSASLRVLEVDECIRLEEFPLQLFISTDMQSECQFTRLGKFQAQRNQIDSCFGHTNIPQLFLIDSLRNIHLSLESNSEEFLLEPIGSSNGLRMEIKGNGQVLRKEGNLFSFDKLRDLVELEISEYPNLTYFAWEGFQQLPSLKKLRMSRCWKLFHPNIELTLPPSIQELEFSSCNITGKRLSLLLLNLGSLKELRLANCDEVTSLPVGMFTDEENQMAAGSWHIPPNCVTTLQSLQISFTRGFGDTRSRMHFFSEKGLGRFMSLKKIVIEDCPALLSSMMSGGACHIAPSCLVKLHVTSIKGHLQFSECSSLVELEIFECGSLRCLNLDSCTALQELKIGRCRLLSSLQGLQSCKELRHLSIADCDVLPSLRASVSTLTTLSIEENPNLAFLDLDSCTALKKLCIRGCATMASWEGHKSLIDLKYLKVQNTPGFTRSWLSAAAAKVDDDTEQCSYFPRALEELDIDDIGVLCEPVCSQLTCLKTLIIHGALDSPRDYVGALTDDHERALLLLTSLKQLKFDRFEHLLSLPAQLGSLTSLQILALDKCPHVTSLPVGGFPDSLKAMDIYNCSRDLNALCRDMCRAQKIHLTVDGTEEEE